MKNTFHCGNLGLTATQIYYDSLKISYKKIINKTFVKALCVKTRTQHGEIIMDSLCLSLIVNVDNLHSSKYGEDMWLTRTCIKP